MHRSAGVERRVLPSVGEGVELVEDNGGWLEEEDEEA